ncbi:hypothetical protein [Paracoccus sp. (in: a-proteobacteria)]|uniref:hypothetical protein n=1 Tax=Paracoccus sp. TaxID=267 RepID=UPI0028A66A68|nr:hypothetical protein [Paracoccus sp. (in: a-proteobacteria)]
MFGSNRICRAGCVWRAGRFEFRGLWEESRTFGFGALSLCSFAPIFLFFELAVSPCRNAGRVLGSFGFVFGSLLSFFIIAQEWSGRRAAPAAGNTVLALDF